MIATAQPSGTIYGPQPVDPSARAWRDVAPGSKCEGPERRGASPSPAVPTSFYDHPPQAAFTSGFFGGGAGPSGFSLRGLGRRDGAKSSTSPSFQRRYVAACWQSS